MGLFKISKGLSKNLPSERQDGHMYYTTDTNDLYLDRDNATRKNLTRVNINTSGGLPTKTFSKDVEGNIDMNMWIDESYISLGRSDGRNWANNSSAIDQCIYPHLGNNLLAGISPSAITLSYSRDGGETWTEFEDNTNAKKLFANTFNAALYIGNDNSSTVTNGGTEKLNYQLRVEVDKAACDRYGKIQKCYVRCSTNGSTSCWCTIEGLSATDDKWRKLTWAAGIAGWPGTNSTRLVMQMLDASDTTANGITPVFGNGSSTKHQSKKLRFTFGTNGPANVGNGTGLKIMGIYLLCTENYSSYNTYTNEGLSKHGQMYHWDENLNVWFPKNLSAPNFSSTYATATNNSMAIGYAKATGEQSLAIGNANTTASGNNSMATGTNQVVSGAASASIGGNGNNVSSGSSVALGGYCNTINNTGSRNFATGTQNTIGKAMNSAIISGENSQIDNTVTVFGAAVSGNHNESMASNSFTAGNDLSNYASSSTVLGKFNAPSSNDIFQIGYGSSEKDRKNALSVNKTTGETTVQSLKSNNDVIATVEEKEHKLSDKMDAEYTAIPNANLKKKMTADWIYKYMPTSISVSDDAIPLKQTVRINTNEYTGTPLEFSIVEPEGTWSALCNRPIWSSDDYDGNNGYIVLDHQMSSHQYKIPYINGLDYTINADYINLNNDSLLSAGTINYSILQGNGGDTYFGTDGVCRQNAIDYSPTFTFDENINVKIPNITGDINLNGRIYLNLDEGMYGTPNYPGYVATIADVKKEIQANTNSYWLQIPWGSVYSSAGEYFEILDLSSVIMNEPCAIEMVPLDSTNIRHHYFSFPGDYDLSENSYDFKIRFSTDHKVYATTDRSGRSSEWYKVVFISKDK